MKTAPKTPLNAHSYMTSKIRAPLFCALLSLACATQLAKAQTWTGGDVPNGNLDWSDANNWSGGAPGSGSTVTFPDGVWPVTTNAVGAVNNIVQSSTTISTLAFDNLASSSDYITTLIPLNTTLTDSGNLTVGLNNGSETYTYVTLTGGGSLGAGTAGSATLTVNNGEGEGPVTTLDLSGLTNFTFGAAGNNSDTFSIGAGGSGSGVTMNLAAVSNSITCGTLDLGYNNTRGTSILNLGNGTNDIFADTINLGFSKTTGQMQFLNNNGGGVMIADHSGSGRATINLSGETSGGSTSAVDTGNMFFIGGTVNILASTLEVGCRGNRAEASALGHLEFNNGVVDATFINMSTNTSGGTAANANISVGGPGVLKVVDFSMINNGSGGAASTANLTLTNGATMICSNAIYKSTASGTATISVAGSRLILVGGATTIGVSNNIAIDDFDVTNSTLTLSAISATTANGPGQADVVVASFNPDTATTNIINIGALPAITSSTMQFPLIQYTAPAGGNVPNEITLTNFALGTLPGNFRGYLSNNLNNSSIDLVLTNAIVAKADEWIGNVNDLWDTTTLNWRNNGVAVNYNDLDFVTFDDNAVSTTVNLTAAREPGTLTFANNILDFTLTGVGNITGPVQLVMNGSATNKLSEGGGDNFSGGIQVNSGEIILDDINSAISGGLTINSGVVQIGNNDANGALPGGGVSDNGTLVYDNTNNVTVSVAISGGGNLTQNGSGALTLSAAEGYSGVTTVNAGTLALSGSGAISSSSGVNVSDATLDVSAVTGNSDITTLQNLSLTNATLNLEAGYIQTNLNITGSLNLGGSANVVNLKSLPAIAYYPATNELVYAAGGITGNNLSLGTLPASATPYVGSVSMADNQDIVLVLTSGPTNSRPSVTWSGSDAINTGNTNWSDGFNWQTPGVPTATEPVFFNNADTAGNTPFDNSGGVGSGGSVDQSQVNNEVNVSLTNMALNYGNSSGYHNTQIASGNTLTINGSVTVNGSGGNVTILGAGGTLQINNPNNNNAFNVEAESIPTLDMSGLDTFTASISQIGIGFDIASQGSLVYGIWYLARTNIITTGSGFAGAGSAWVIGGSTSQDGAGYAQVYLGQTNAIYVDGIVLGVSANTTGNSDLLTFNPNLTNPAVYIRGITGPSSRVTEWSLGDNSVNLNNHDTGYGNVVDFTAGTLNALVNTLIVGQGSQGNEANANVVGTFNMGAGILNVLTLDVGASGTGDAGSGIGVMNVTGGTVVADTLNMPAIVGTGGESTTTGTLNLNNATLVLDNGISIAGGTGGGTLSETNSTIEFGSGTIGSSALNTPITTLNLSGGTLQFNVNGASGNPNIDATTVNTNGPATLLQISSLSGVTTGVPYPLISYTGTDPFGDLTLAPLPSGYTGTLVDNSNSDLVELQLTSVPVAAPQPVITGVSIRGNTLTISATNGVGGGQYTLYETTNLAPPVVWTPVFTNSFSGTGTINLSTNVVNSATREFYLLEEP